MPTICITRPEASAHSFIQQCQKHGFNTLLAPVTTIEPCQNAPTKLRALEHTKVERLLISSQHALSAFSLVPALHNIPCWVVGEHTASALKDKGAIIEHTAPTMKALLNIITNTSPTRQVLYLRGQYISYNIEKTLQTSVHNCDELIVYTAREINWPHTIIDSWRATPPTHISFFSARSAILAEKKLHHHQLTHTCHDIHAFCLSKNIADTLTLAWKAIDYPTHPAQNTMESLLESYKITGKTHDSRYNEAHE